MGHEGWKILQPRAAHLFILIYTLSGCIGAILREITYYIHLTINILSEIIIYISSHDISSCNIYMRSTKIIKTKQKYMKQWRSNLARLNKIIQDYMLDNYKVVDYGVKKPSPRPNITWRPYGYYKWRRSTIAHRKCIKYIQGMHKTIEEIGRASCRERV
jgi:hypothetical protein